MAFDGLVALVTGGGSGMGRAAALALADRGARVLVTDVQKSAKAGGYDDDQDTDTDDLIRARGGTALFRLADVSCAGDMEASVALAAETFGRLDIMVNNAGIGTTFHSVVDMPEEDYDRTMAINAKGVFLGSKYAIGQMMRQSPRAGGHRGAVVNVASIAAIVGLPGRPAYCASKGAVTALTRQMAVEFGPHNIRVNAVLPGVIETSLTRDSLSVPGEVDFLRTIVPLPLFGSAQHVAAAIAFLASDEAAFVNGASLVIDGGHVAV